MTGQWEEKALESVNDFVWHCQQFMEIRDWHVIIDTTPCDEKDENGVEIGASVTRTPNSKRAVIHLPANFFDMKDDVYDNDEERGRYLIHELCHLLIFPLEHYVADSLEGLMSAAQQVMWDKGMLEQVEVLADTLSFGFKAHADAVGIKFLNPYRPAATEPPAETVSPEENHA